MLILGLLAASGITIILLVLSQKNNTKLRLSCKHNLKNQSNVLRSSFIRCSSNSKNVIKPDNTAFKPSSPKANIATNSLFEKVFNNK